MFNQPGTLKSGLFFLYFVGYQKQEYTFFRTKNKYQKKGTRCMKKFNGCLLCEIKGYKKISSKEYQVLLFPEIPGLEMKVSIDVVKKYPENTAYLLVMEANPSMVSIREKRIKRVLVWDGKIRQEGEETVLVSGTIFTNKSFVYMHEKTANEWKKVISVTVAYIGDRQKANEFVEKYLKSILSLTPQKVFDERAGISSWENMSEALRYVYADAVEKDYRVPTTAELERWLWNLIVYAIRLGVVFLNRQELRFDIKKMLSAYSKC